MDKTSAERKTTQWMLEFENVSCQAKQAKDEGWWLWLHEFAWMRVNRYYLDDLPPPPPECVWEIPDDLLKRVQAWADRRQAA